MHGKQVLLRKIFSSSLRAKEQSWAWTSEQWFTLDRQNVIVSACAAISFTVTPTGQRQIEAVQQATYVCQCWATWCPQLHGIPFLTSHSLPLQNAVTLIGEFHKHQGIPRRTQRLGGIEHTGAVHVHRQLVRRRPGLRKCDTTLKLILGSDSASKPHSDSCQNSTLVRANSGCFTPGTHLQRGEVLHGQHAPAGAVVRLLHGHHARPRRVLVVWAVAARELQRRQAISVAAWRTATFPGDGKRQASVLSKDIREQSLFVRL